MRRLTGIGLFACLGLPAIAASLFAPPLEPPWPLATGTPRGLLQLLALGLLGAGTAVRAVTVLRRGVETGGGDELALLVAVAAAATAQAAGGPTSPWYPLTYLALALVAFWASPLLALFVAAGLGMAEAVAASLAGRLAEDATRLLAHGAFQGLFAVGPGALLRAERRRKEEAILKLDRLRGDASDLAPDERLRREEAAVAPALAMDESLQRILAEVLAAHAPDGVVYLAVDEGTGRLKVRYVLPEGRPVDLGRLYARDEGVFRWLWEKRRALHIPVVQAGFRGIPYYPAGTPVRSFLAVPVLEGRELRGALCIDAERPHAFGHEQERLLHFAAQQIAEAYGQARRLSATSREAREYEALYKAVRRLTSTLSLPDLFKEVLEAAHTIAPYDRAALLLADGDGSQVTLAALAPVPSGEEGGADAGGRGPQPPPPLASLVGRSFPVADTRLGWALAQDLYLNFASARERKGGRPLFPRGLKLAMGESCLVLPFKKGGQAAGALVLMDRRPGAYGRSEIRLLEILAPQAAVAIAHARLHRQTEEMANTDGLTGLLNRRRFEERLAEEFARAARAPSPFSLLVADIDHFKRINDSHGHPAGDLVLRQVARRLVRQARTSDAVSRLGGEEFGLLLVQADRAGALAFAERVREDIAGMPIELDTGELRVTLSIGLASFPEDGTEPVALLARADQALYDAKRGGRNRVCVARPGVSGASGIALTARIP